MNKNIIEPTAADLADYEEAFELFDKDGDGTISTSELRNLLRCFGKKASEKDVIEILRKNLKDSNQEEINFEEFTLIMG